jgi:putative heme-binding domain-containing protein
MMVPDMVLRMPLKQFVRWFCCLTAVACACGRGEVFAAESWADANMPVQGGLELWLDASRAAPSDAEWPANGKLVEWRDASGHKRNVGQDSEAARPKLTKVGDVAVVQFDGVDDHFRAVGQNAKLEEFTLVIVAAPRQKLGGFRALMALNASNERDYTSGLNVDLGPGSSLKFSALNVEGAGLVGWQNLRTKESPFGRLATLVLASDGKALRLTVDGAAEGSRARNGGPLSADEFTVGARYFNNAAGPQRPEGFGRSDIAEILLYNRDLAPEEIEQLQKYLDAKWKAAKNALPADKDSPQLLKPVDNPPPVQMFVPGFTVRELPIDLQNLNNVKYRQDGTLVAVAYDGTIWLLRDTNGDGLEDKADQFWDNQPGLRSAIGMDLTPPDYAHGDGVFVVGKTRCMLVVDTNDDDRADKAIDLVSGWKESFHQVDGLGVAFDPRDGSVYFGRGTYNFSDPLLRDKDGNPQFSLTDESGAVIRVSPDLKSHEIVATGIRFPVSLRLNRGGDLFATDQEGATWVANGNPFDELLHIQKGRHYGFPPRHPEHVPDVIDEPSTFDYAPQHQSTCGMNFNEPVQGDGPTFGPPAWRGDALVTGYSRGKLYRTQLVKSPTGYVARTQLLACLKMLTVDACVAPDGSLIVACHSGGPDWGSGPTGKGKLFKIEYADKKHPQSAFAWAAGDREVRVEFDRPVDPSLLHEVLAKSKLTAGPYVRAGDRFESIAPGYAAVEAQKAAERIDIPLRSAQLTPDGRTLVFATDRISKAVHYALELPGMGRPDPAAAAEQNELPQHAAIDLDFDLTGCEATWTAADGGATWTGWLPHLDLEVSRQFTKGCAHHDALWNAMQKPGTLTLRLQLELSDMLRPAIQPGSKIDYEYPPEAVTVYFAAAAGSTLKLESPLKTAADDATQASLTVPSDAAKTVPIELELTTTTGSPSLTTHWITNEDDRPRPLPLRRIFLPWANLNEKVPADIVVARPPELEGGSWARGYREFFGDKAGCSKCHALYERGGQIGPDLSNLIHRDYPSVLRDITHPSFAINPDYLSYSLVLTDGRTLTGVVRTVGDTIEVGDANGSVTRVLKSEVDDMQPAAVSTMPDNLVKELGEERLRDLMTFLLTPPPQMPRDLAEGRPKPRSMSEVKEAIAGAPDPPQETRPIHIVLAAGQKDHGVGEHDYPGWQKAWAELLAAGDNVEVSTAWEWPEKDDFAKADVIVFYQRGDWNASRAADIDAFQKRGGGLVYIHWALDGRDPENGRQFAGRIGLAAGTPIAFRHGALTMRFNRETNHPIIRNFDRLELMDETYWKLTGDVAPGSVLGSAIEDAAAQPQLWTMEHGKGRVFVSIPGHYSWTFDDPLFRTLLLRGIAWSAHEPVDRFNNLIWPGADIAK